MRSAHESVLADQWLKRRYNNKQDEENGSNNSVLSNDNSTTQENLSDICKSIHGKKDKMRKI